MPCYKYASLNIATKSNNCNISHLVAIFQEFKSLSLVYKHLKNKDMKTFLSFSPEHGEKSCFSGTGKYVISARIRSYSGAHYLVFALNTERYGVSLCIQSKCGKMRTRITRVRTLFTQWEVRLLLRDISFLYLRSSLKQVQGLIRGQISLGYERLGSVMASKFDARNLEQEMESNINFDHADSLQ